jgi:hypothetical protein
MNIDEKVRKAEKLSKAQAEKLEEMLDEIVKANPSMPPEIYQPDATIQIETNYGGQSIDADVLGKEELKKLKHLIAQSDMEGAQHILESYMEGTVLESAEIVEGGWIAHLSMPGYMDQTEPTRYDTLKEAIESLHEQFADDY